MSVKTEVINKPEEVTIYFCDFCGERIGPAPIDKLGGYFVACSVAARDDSRPLWHAEVCRSCIDDLRQRTGFDAK